MTPTKDELFLLFMRKSLNVIHDDQNSSRVWISLHPGPVEISKDEIDALRRRQHGVRDEPPFSDRAEAAAAEILWKEIGYSTPWTHLPQETRDFYIAKARRVLKVAREVERAA